MSYETSYSGRRRTKTESVIEEVVKTGLKALRGCQTGKALLLPSPPRLCFSLPPCSDLPPSSIPPCVFHCPPNHKNSTRSLSPFFSKALTTIQLSVFPPSQLLLLSTFLNNLSLNIPLFFFYTSSILHGLFFHEIQLSCHLRNQKLLVSSSLWSLPRRYQLKKSFSCLWFPH